MTGKRIFNYLNLSRMVFSTPFVSRFVSATLVLAIVLLGAVPDISGAQTLSAADVLTLKSCSNAAISPDGQWIAYLLDVPRKSDDAPGSAYRELYLVSVKTGAIRPFITGKVSISSPRWRPDGSQIAFLTRRGEKAQTQVWRIHIDGGESIQVTCAKTDVADFRWHPSGKAIAYTAETPQTPQEQKLADKGYGFIFYEENLKDRNLYQIDIDAPGDQPAEQLTWGVTVWNFEFSPDGLTIAASISDKNLVDHEYMFRRIHLIDLATQSHFRLTDNPGKLGNFAFSPDGTMLAYGAAKTRADHAVSQVYVIDVKGGQARNLTAPDFQGHVEWVGWKDKTTLVYYAGEGVWPTLSLVKITGGTRTVLLDARDKGVVFDTPSYTPDFKHFTFIGSNTAFPNEVFYWQQGQDFRLLTDSNPWLKDRTLGKQEIIRYPARDGRQIEGLLIHPVGFQPGRAYPLVVIVHGGPEAHYSNGWITRYSEPGQVLAGKGYLVFYPNYRASTGYGVDFAMQGYQDPAGKEFDDIADGIDFLVQQDLADPERVGLGGGSYGGYAAAWFASYYTQKVRAVCMFVGISNIISKRGTTDIPYEELYVHSGQKLEDMWELSLKRSPIYWAHQSQTAVLIMGGTADTRVDPSQGLEFYRCLKMNQHPAVRLVQYPGEGHGNRKQPGRVDLLYRLLDWYDWYVMNKNPLDGPMPPLDLSGRYGLKLDE